MVGRSDTDAENDENVSENGGNTSENDQNQGDGGTETPDTPSGDQNTDTTPKKRVAITIDDGPYSAYQQKFVDEMKKYGGAGTFFIVGNRVEWNTSTGTGLAYAVENGWDIGIHAWTHEKANFFDVCSDDVYYSELSKTEAIIQKYVPGYDVKLLRPPGGQITAARANASEYAIIRWDVDSYDYNYKTNTESRPQEQSVQAIVDNVMAQVRDGSIILMHELYENSYLAYCRILQLLDEQGYEFVSVTELLGDKYQAGKTFTSGR